MITRCRKYLSSLSSWDETMRTLFPPQTLHGRHNGMSDSRVKRPLSSWKIDCFPGSPEKSIATIVVVGDGSQAEPVALLDGAEAEQLSYKDWLLRSTIRLGDDNPDEVGRHIILEYFLSGRDILWNKQSMTS